MTNTMTCEQFEALVPRLLEDEIELTADMRSHLDGCESCRSLLADLRRIGAEAGELPSLVPERDLWSGIATRIEAPVVNLPSRRGQRHISLRVAGIAAAVLMLVSTTVTYQLVRRPQPDTKVASGVSTALPAPRDTQRASTPSAAVPPAAPARGVNVSNNAKAKVDYDREIVKLRAIVDSGRTRLDPATVALLERNLSVIDSAIVQCRDALAKDPASRFLNESLNSAYQSKMKLLKIAAAASAE